MDSCSRYWRNHPFVFGSRWCWWMSPFIWPCPLKPKESEVIMLENQARLIEQEMEIIKKRLVELKNKEVA